MSPSNYPAARASSAASPAVIQAQAAATVDLLHQPTKGPFQDNC